MKPGVAKMKNQPALRQSRRARAQAPGGGNRSLMTAQERRHSRPPPKRAASSASRPAPAPGSRTSTACSRCIAPWRTPRRRWAAASAPRCSRHRQHAGACRRRMPSPEQMAKLAERCPAAVANEHARTAAWRTRIAARPGPGLPPKFPRQLARPGRPWKAALESAAIRASEEEAMTADQGNTLLQQPGRRRAAPQSGVAASGIRRRCAPSSGLLSSSI